ncbi:hypothetical protein [Helicobacter monodelphidis]|nr:hypothetical protein [Helicobacter sp. 15-1451]
MFRLIFALVIVLSAVLSGLLWADDHFLNSSYCEGKNSLLCLDSRIWH